MNMSKIFFYNIICLFLLSINYLSCKSKEKDFTNKITTSDEWEIDFLDEFETFNTDNWQDQLLWVNNEKQCYVPDNLYGTREVSDGTIKLKVINIGEEIVCHNMDKHGKKHPNTKYVAGRITSKNRKEFIKGKWTAKLKINGKTRLFKNS